MLQTAMLERDRGENLHSSIIHVFMHAAICTSSILHGERTHIVCSLNTLMGLDERGSQVKAQAAVDIMGIRYKLTGKEGPIKHRCCYGLWTRTQFAHMCRSV